MIANILNTQVEEAGFTEEERSRQHSIFSVVRCITALFSSAFSCATVVAGSSAAALTSASRSSCESERKMGSASSARVASSAFRLRSARRACSSSGLSSW